MHIGEILRSQLWGNKLYQLDRLKKSKFFSREEREEREARKEKNFISF